MQHPIKGVMTMKKIVTKKMIKEIKQCFPNEREHRVSVSLRRLDSSGTDARFVTVLFLSMRLLARKTGLMI